MIIKVCIHDSGSPDNNLKVPSQNFQLDFSVFQMFPGHHSTIMTNNRFDLRMRNQYCPSDL